MIDIIEMLKGTPWWVYVLFIYLLGVGIEALKTHTVPIYRLFIFPVIFFVWGFYSLMQKCGNSFDFFIWIFSLCAGIGIGWLLFRHLILKIDRQNSLVTFAGSYSLLILIVTIFCVKYFFGFMHATSLFSYAADVIQKAEIIVSGVITGIFIGRVVLPLAFKE